MGLNTDTAYSNPYRIGPGTYVPLMFDPTGGGAWCAALCGTHMNRSSHIRGFSILFAEGKE